MTWFKQMNGPWVTQKRRAIIDRGGGPLDHRPGFPPPDNPCAVNHRAAVDDAPHPKQRSVEAATGPTPTLSPDRGLPVFVTRKIGKLLHGKTSTFSVLTATALGAAAGFVPAEASSAPLLATLGVLVLVMNTNLFLAGAAAGIGKLLSLPLLTASFALGRLLIDGPLQPLFRFAVNAPGLAWLGLDVYVVPGALLLGGVSGIAMGTAVLFTLSRLRHALAGLETGSDRYAALTGRRWVKTLRWVLLGKRGKASYTELAERHARWGNPVRPLGAVAAAMLLSLTALMAFFTSDRLATALITAGLEKANGATVDLERAQIDLRRGRINLSGLAVADPEALDHNLFAAGTLTGDLSVHDLLRRRLAIDLIEMDHAQTGTRRELPAQRVGSAPGDAPPAATPAPSEAEDGGETTSDPPRRLDDLFVKAKTWKRRLDRLRGWVEWWSGPEPATAEADADPDADDKPWIQRQAHAAGLARVRAHHLLEGAPTLLVRRIVIDGLTVGDQPGASYHVEIRRLSTHPARVTGGPPALTAHSADGGTRLELTAPGTGHPHGVVALDLGGIDIDAAARGLHPDVARLAGGGTADLALRGSFNAHRLDLPLSLTLHDTAVALPGTAPRTLARLPLALHVAGSMTHPTLQVDRALLTDALVAAGAHELANAARDRATNALNQAKDRLGQELESGLGATLGNGLTEVVDDRFRGFFKRD